MAASAARAPASLAGGDAVREHHVEAEHGRAERAAQRLDAADAEAQADRKRQLRPGVDHRLADRSSADDTAAAGGTAEQLAADAPALRDRLRPAGADERRREAARVASECGVRLAS